jgi:hypothetical protein
MSSGGIMGFLSVNRSLTNLGDEARSFRLPVGKAFPKLDQRIAGPASVTRRCDVVIEGKTGGLPEMATDVTDLVAGYAVENVKRDRTEGSASKMSFWVGRILGGQRAARSVR